jgi:parallel beta-helix repeat protein
MKFLTQLSVIATAAFLPNIVGAVTVGGIISTNTVWSNTTEPYTFSSAVQVKNGVTLTIAPGVQLQSGSISVFGNIQIAGTKQAPVQLNGVTIVPAGNGDPAKLFSMDIQNMQMTGGSLYYPTGNAIYGTLRLQDSVLTNVPYMYVWYPTSNVLIKGNIFNNFGGISVGSSSTNVLIENNLFNGSGQMGYLVENWASYGSAMTTVRYNSFLNSIGTAVMLPAGYSSAALDARYNYWGTTNAAAIEARIYDDNDNLAAAGSIAYSPFLTNAHPDTPSMSPVPEPISAALFFVGLGLVSVRMKIHATSSSSAGIL